MVKISLYTALFLLLTGCGSLKTGNQTGKGMPGKMTSAEYLTWYSSDAYPFRDTVEQDGITYICAFISRETEIAMQVENQLISVEEAALLLKDSPEMLQFQLQVMLPQAGTDVFHYKLKSHEDVSSRTAYFSFGIQKDLTIRYQGQDTLDCSFSHFERGIANFPVSKVMAYFPYRKEAVESVSFDTRIFSGGKISFDFQSLNVTRLPQLKL